MNYDDIQQKNAEELGHLENQITLSWMNRAYVSNFLKIVSSETMPAYNSRLAKLIEYLKQIPNHNDCIKHLRFAELYATTWEWHSPIECTPKSHTAHGTYIRILAYSKENSAGKCIPRFTPSKDEHIGKLLPNIFYHDVSILGSKIQHLIGPLYKHYTVIKKFGSFFSDILEVDGMKFTLLTITNPKYLEKSKGNIVNIDDRIIVPMTDTEYTSAYKIMIQRRN